FFFQAEDGIRDFHVTGVQTCALPISQTAVHLRREDSCAHELDGDELLILFVRALGEPYVPHAAGAEFPQESVRPESLPAERRFVRGFEIDVIRDRVPRSCLLIGLRSEKDTSELQSR